VKRLLLVLAAAAALWSAACSSGSGTIIPPPPSVGTFDPSNLKGTYAFVTNGEVFVSGGITATPLARAGSFLADGLGNITGGVEDANSAGTVSPPIAITGGSYTVKPDGRGTLTLLFGQASINFGFTLTSINGGLLIDETSNANQASTGSGNFIKQDPNSFLLSGIAGPYVFDFSGFDSNVFPESFIGRFDAANGVFNSGFFDDNDNFNLINGSFVGNYSQDNLNPSFPLGTFGRGVAQLAGQSFVFYIVNSNRVRFISTSNGMLSGDAVAQNNTIPADVGAINGGFAFVAAGASSAGSGITRIGRFTAAGSATLTNVLQDTNNSGKFFQTNSTLATGITLDPANPGRGTFTFTDPAFPTAPSKFIFYLSSATQGVIQEVTTSGGALVAVADGSLSAQSGGPFTTSNVSGPYALNWSGLSFQQNGQFIDEEDLVGQVAISNLFLTGTSDIFQFTNGVPVTNLATSGKIAFAGDGTGGDGTGSSGLRNTMPISLNGNSQIQFVVYFVNPQLAFFTNNSNSSTTRIVAGVLQAQQEP
jgi:hypothetical protein